MYEGLMYSMMSVLLLINSGACGIGFLWFYQIMNNSLMDWIPWMSSFCSFWGMILYLINSKIILELKPETDKEFLEF